MINITKEMTDELNYKLKEQGCIFRFKFRYYSKDIPIGVIYPEFINKKFLHFLSKCEIDQDGMDFIYKFFQTKGIDWIIHTRAGELMAYQYDGKVY